MPRYKQTFPRKSTGGQDPRDRPMVNRMVPRAVDEVANVTANADNTSSSEDGMHDSVESMGPWGDVPHMMTMSGRRYSFASVILGEKIYVFGGGTPPLGSGCSLITISTAEVYDTNTRVWTSLPPTPTEGMSCTASAIEEKIYVVGSFDDMWGEIDNTAQVFDTMTNTWATISPMSKKRSDCASASVDGRFYVFGTEENGSLSAEAYNPSADSWEVVPPPPAENRYGQNQIGVANDGGKIYVVGGIDRDDKAVNAAQAYDVKSGTWETLPNMNANRSGCAVAIACDLLCVLGGDDEAYGDPANTAEAFDPIANVWTTLPPMKIARSEFAGVAIKDKVFVMGGRVSRGGPGVEITDSTEPYDVSSHLSTIRVSRKRSLEVAADEKAKKRLKATATSILQEFLCPITTELPVDPVIAMDSRVYERSAIAASIKRQQDNIRSPMTNESMGPRLLSATSVRNAIEKLVNDESMEGNDLAERWKERYATFKEVRDVQRRASENNDAFPMYQLGCWHENGEKDLPQDLEEAYMWFKKASQLHHVKALAATGVCCLMGKGTTRRSAYSMHLLTRAEMLGSDRAAYFLARMFEKEQEVEMAKTLYRRIINGYYAVKHLSQRLRDLVGERLEELEG